MRAQWPQANEVASSRRCSKTSLGSPPCSLSRIVQSDPKIDDVGKDGDHMDDQEQGEERVEKQVAEQTCDISADSLFGAWLSEHLGTTSQMAALCLGCLPMRKVTLSRV